MVKLAQPLFAACLMGLLAACGSSQRAEAPPPAPLPMAPPPLAAAPPPGPEIAPPVRERVVRKHRRTVRHVRHHRRVKQVTKRAVIEQPAR